MSIYATRTVECMMLLSYLSNYPEPIVFLMGSIDNRCSMARGRERERGRGCRAGGNEEITRVRTFGGTGFLKKEKERN